MKKENKCKGCGKCCYNVPLPKAYIFAFKNKIVNEFKSVLLDSDSTALGIPTILAETKDMICPFLTKNKTCNIYDKRPSICRKFGTDRSNPLLICPILEEGKETPVLNLSVGEILQNAICLPEARKMFSRVINDNDK